MNQDNRSGKSAEAPPPLPDPWRFYALEVVAKWEGTHGYGSLTLRPPSLNGQPLDLYRPWWPETSPQGGPLGLSVTPEEYEAVGVGDLFAVTIAPFSDTWDDPDAEGGTPSRADEGTPLDDPTAATEAAARSLGLTPRPHAQ